MNEITVIYKGVGDLVEYEMFEGKGVGYECREGCIVIWGDDKGLVIPIERLVAITYRHLDKGADISVSE